MSAGSRWRRIGALAVVLIALIATAPSGAAAEPPNAPLGKGDFAGLIGIGDGRSIYLECHGRGAPTVILEAGLRSRSDYWSAVLDETTPTPTVLPALARRTRVCTYDRPGTTLGTDAFSRSTPVPMPRTARDAAADLNDLLQAADVPGPYLLTGHSTGGLIQRLYAARHPRRVAGLVQVDALSEFVADYLSSEQTAALDALNNDPVPGLEGYEDLEAISFVKSFAQMRRAADRNPLRGVPVTVIARRLPVELPAGQPAGLTTEVFDRAWGKSQRMLAMLTPDARFRVAERSSHYVMFSQPRLIVHAVWRIVEEIRGDRS